MDPFLIIVALGGAASLAAPVSLLYQNHLLKHSSRNAIHLDGKGETEKAIRYLRWVLFCLPPKPATNRINPQIMLGTMCLRAERFAEGEAYLRTALSGCSLLKKPNAIGAIEARIRINIANALEAQGNVDGGTAERDIATNCLLKEEIRDHSWHLLRALDLKQRRQYAEAVTEYWIGLQNLPPSIPASQRGHEIIDLASCLMEMEHATASLFYLEKSLTCSLPSSTLMYVYFLMASQFRSLNRLEDAEHSYRAAVEARTGKDRDGSVLDEIHQWQIGDAQLLRGDLQNARQTLSTFADSVGTADSIGAELLASDLEMWEGNFSSSLERVRRLRQSITGGSFALHWQKMLPSLDVYLRLRTVCLHLLLREPENALAELENVLPKEDGVQRWNWEAFEISALAYSETAMDSQRKTELQGRVLTIKRLIETDFTRRISEGAEPADADAALRVVVDNLIYAALSLEMYEVALDLCQRYLEMNPYPVNIPEIYCRLGECQAALGNCNDARAAWQTAVNFGIDTYESQIAKEKLTALRNAD